MGMISLRVVLFALLLAASPLLQVARCQSEAESDVADAVEAGDLGIVGEEYVQPFGDGKFDPAPGVETICIFPKNSAKLVVAGEQTELLVGMENVGGPPLNIIAIQASVHLPYDHRMLVQNLTAQTFENASVSPSVQATFPYMFAVSKYLQAGIFDLVGTVLYEIDQNPYQNTFYNVPLMLLRLVVSSVLSLFFLLPSGLHFLSSLVYGFKVNFSASPRKLRRLQRWKSELGLLIRQWMNGFRELLTLSQDPNQRKRSRSTVLMKSGYC